jgi:hypothetical protein
MDTQFKKPTLVVDNVNNPNLKRLDDLLHFIMRTWSRDVLPPRDPVLEPVFTEIREILDEVTPNGYLTHMEALEHNANVDRKYSLTLSRERERKGVPAQTMILFEMGPYSLCYRHKGGVNSSLGLLSTLK